MRQANTTSFTFGILSCGRIAAVVFIGVMGASKLLNLDSFGD